VPGMEPPRQELEKTFGCNYPVMPTFECLLTQRWGNRPASLWIAEDFGLSFPKIISGHIDESSCFTDTGSCSRLSGVYFGVGHDTML
ncbi:hypothetical protein, partial [Rhodoplanes sp. JGI PP 4-B12]|uniref:hypothetical protein n=1 Tax=Rhodoplanes sp. JGI PP 4-B12 TaxID=1873883 RepID=UPI0013564500